MQEPYRLEHFLLRGKACRHGAEIAKLEFIKRGMLAPTASWAIKSVMWQGPLGSCLPVNCQDATFFSAALDGCHAFKHSPPVVALSLGTGNDLRSWAMGLRIHSL